MMSWICSSSRLVFLIFCWIDHRCLARPPTVDSIPASFITSRSFWEVWAMYTWRPASLSLIRDCRDL